MIRRADGLATVIALEDAYSGEDKAALGYTALLTARVQGPRFFGYAPDLARLFRQADPDILHLHGIWMYPSRPGAEWARKTGRPYVVSPHGMLDPWITGRGRWKKARAQRVYERGSWRRAAALHALTLDEAADIRRETGRDQVLVIANAAPPSTPLAGGERDPLIVYLGRIHTKKNLEALVSAWSAADVPDQAELVIAGWGDPADVQALEAVLRSARQTLSCGAAIYVNLVMRQIERLPKSFPGRRLLMELAMCHGAGAMTEISR
jgi:poly(glycerol-phosphate) alpha-glucosyltransferase